MIRDCQLICPNNTHDPIPLPDGVPVKIGRSPQTRIMDPRCSRNQVEITANWTSKEITVKQLAVNSSALDGVELEQNRLCRMPLGATIYVLAGLYPHKVMFTEDSSAEEGKQMSGCLKNDGQKRKRVSENSETTPNSKKAKLKSKAGSVSKEDSCGTEDKKLEEIEKKLQALKDNTNKESSKRSSTNKQSHKNHNESASLVKEKHNSASDSPSSSKGSNSGEPVKQGMVYGWQNIDNKLYIYTSEGLKSGEKIAAFDIDGTIITTQSGRVFPKDPGDWRILYPEIPAKLKKARGDGFKIVLFTNQKGVTTGKSNIEDLKNKFTNILKKIGVAAQIFVSTGVGIYRKPASGMWDYFRKHCNEGIKIDYKTSFYVGDAAGRPEASGKKKDFSCSDRLFALNIGLPFHTPEEYFKGQPLAKFTMPEYDPRSKVKLPLLDPPSTQIISSTQEVIVLVGLPAAGKSTFAKNHLVSKGYAYANRDTLGTWQKCVTLCKNSLKEGKSVVIDNTNKTKGERARYVDCAKKANVQCRCFVFQTTIAQCKHNERFREMTNVLHSPINEMIFNSFRKSFESPNMEEGFDSIVKVNFVPELNEKKDEKLYRQFLLEK